MQKAILFIKLVDVKYFLKVEFNMNRNFDLDNAIEETGYEQPIKRLLLDTTLQNFTLTSVV